MKNKILPLLVALVFAAGGFGLATYLFKVPDQTAASIRDSEIRTIYLDDALRNSGLNVQRVLLAKRADKATIYASFTQPFSGTVILKAYDRTGAEIGRSRRNISGKTDEATYVDFEYNTNVPLKLAESFKLVYAQSQPVVVESETPEPMPEADSEVETAMPQPAEETASAPTEVAAEAPENEVPEEVSTETESAPDQTAL